MSDARRIVVKVGGSLFDLPDLKMRLDRFLASLGDANVLIVPGGGALADVVRMHDQTHQLGEEASHWLAITALSVNARFLQALLPDAKLIGDWRAPDDRATYILDALPFFEADEANADHLLHSWDVTSDSLAVRAATLIDAGEVILLKSVDWSGNDWSSAGKANVVDGYFGQALRSTTLQVRVVNLRTFD
jgi:aspartokinase-like uncharacterized kinase